MERQLPSQEEITGAASLLEPAAADEWYEQMLIRMGMINDIEAAFKSGTLTLEGDEELTQSYRVTSAEIEMLSLYAKRKGWL